jgi:hypothetical protein
MDQEDHSIRWGCLVHARGSTARALSQDAISVDGILQCAYCPVELICQVADLALREDSTQLAVAPQLILTALCPKALPQGIPNLPIVNQQTPRVVQLVRTGYPEYATSRTSARCAKYRSFRSRHAAASSCSVASPVFVWPSSSVQALTMSSTAPEFLLDAIPQSGASARVGIPLIFDCVVK